MTKREIFDGLKHKRVRGELWKGDMIGNSKQFFLKSLNLILKYFAYLMDIKRFFSSFLWFLFSVTRRLAKRRFRLHLSFFPTESFWSREPILLQSSFVTHFLIELFGRLEVNHFTGFLFSRGMSLMIVCGSYAHGWLNIDSLRDKIMKNSRLFGKYSSPPGSASIWALRLERKGYVVCTLDLKI